MARLERGSYLALRDDFLLAFAEADAREEGVLLYVDQDLVEDGVGEPLDLALLLLFGKDDLLH